MKRFPPVIMALLVLSLILTTARAATLPFITIYLTTGFHLSPDYVGAILGISFAIGILSNIYSGFLVDKMHRHILIMIVSVLFACCFFLLPWLPKPLFFIIILAIIHAAYTTSSIAIKAYCAACLPSEERIKAFSANYTLSNVGWACGPTIGSFLAAYHINGPFYFSGVLSLLAFAFISIWFKKHSQNESDMIENNKKTSFKQTLSLLKKDKRLIFFTLGTTLGAIISGQFSGYISQYLIITTHNPEYSYKVIGAIMSINGLVVIALQYLISSRMKQQTLLRWLTMGVLFFSLGLVGFMFSLSIPTWCFSMAIFTLGEITVVPAQYLFIDFIAPANLKGSYYGIQSLGNLGGAINPILCGVLLTHFAPHVMFYVLLIIMFISLYFFYHGFHLKEKLKNDSVEIF